MGREGGISQLCLYCKPGLSVYRNKEVNFMLVNISQIMQSCTVPLIFCLKANLWPYIFALRECSLFQIRFTSIPEKPARHGAIVRINSMGMLTYLFILICFTDATIFWANGTARKVNKSLHITGRLPFNNHVIILIKDDFQRTDPAWQKAGAILHMNKLTFS